MAALPLLAKSVGGFAFCPGHIVLMMLPPQPTEEAGLGMGRGHLIEMDRLTRSRS
jgi:hypothetical protein